MDGRGVGEIVERAKYMAWQVILRVGNQVDLVWSSILPKPRFGMAGINSVVYMVNKGVSKCLREREWGVLSNERVWMGKCHWSRWFKDGLHLDVHSDGFTVFMQEWGLGLRKAGCGGKSG